MKALLLLWALVLIPAAIAQGGIGSAVFDTREQAQQALSVDKYDILLAYITQEDRLAIMQTQAILGEDEITALIDRYEPGLKAAPDREKLLSDAASDLTASMKLTLGEEVTVTEAQRQASLCAILKDGVCDKACPGIDLDCLCGDGICESYENQDICPVDCTPTKNRICMLVRDNVCDTTCPGFDVDCELTALIDTTMGYYAKDENFYSYTMTILSIAMMLLFGISIWLLHDIHNIRFGGP